MPKDRFSFKQFIVLQDQCAMKVCTDACVFGALIPANDQTQYILDIGSGTGLLSLMLAQRSQAFIDAVEVDEEGAKQSRENVLRSPWKDRIYVHHLSIQEFLKVNIKKYDLIVSNPPFFYNNLLSSDPKFNIAGHSQLLTLDELACIASSMLKHDGTLAILLPPYQASLFEKSAIERRLMLYNDISLRHAENTSIFRKINFYRPTGCLNHFHENEIIIRNKDGDYSLQFQELLKPYYTIFN